MSQIMSECPSLMSTAITQVQDYCESFLPGLSISTLASDLTYTEVIVVFGPTNSLSKTNLCLPSEPGIKLTFLTSSSPHAGTLPCLANLVCPQCSSCSSLLQEWVSLLEASAFPSFRPRWTSWAMLSNLVVPCLIFYDCPLAISFIAFIKFCN